MFTLHFCSWPSQHMWWEFSISYSSFGWCHCNIQINIQDIELGPAMWQLKVDCISTKQRGRNVDEIKLKPDLRQIYDPMLVSVCLTLQLHSQGLWDTSTKKPTVNDLFSIYENIHISIYMSKADWLKVDWTENIRISIFSSAGNKQKDQHQHRQEPLQTV